MEVYQCAQCMKKFVDGRKVTLLCPFCRCRVLPYRGPAPINLCKTPLLSTFSPALPLPLVSQLSFHLVPLTDDNYDFWENYAGAMRIISRHLDFSDTQKDGWAQAVKGFLDAFKCYKETPSSQVWIAVATYGSISQHNFAQSAVDIEMCMTVTTHQKVPFTTHMGIFRSPLRCVKMSSLERIRNLGINMFRLTEVIELLERDWSLLRSARNISGQLHAFAAKRCLQDCGGVPKRYMITAPLKKMMEIMKKKYGAHATEEINLIKENGQIAVYVNSERFCFAEDEMRTYRWLSVLADLDGSRPKIAIDINALARSMEERVRVESVLDWLDKWA